MMMVPMTRVQAAGVRAIPGQMMLATAAVAFAAATATAAAEAKAAAAAGPDLDCKMHVLALQFAEQLLPERSLDTGLGAVAAGLQVITSDPQNLTCSFGPVPPPAPPPPPPPPPPQWPAKGTCTAPVAGWSMAEEAGARTVGTPCKTNPVGKCVPTVAACEALCTGNCSGYTWHDKTTGSYFEACYLATEKDPWHGGVSIDKGHLSGICNNGQPPPPSVPPPMPASGKCSAIVDGWSLTTGPAGPGKEISKVPSAAACEALCQA